MIGQRLRALRKESGLTLKQMAEKVGLTVSAYSNYEQGIREPSLDTLKRICQAFNVSSDYLLGLSDI